MSVFLFPGQGSQKPGMAQDYYERSSVARETLDEAAAAVGPDLLGCMFNGSDEALRDTRMAQVALVATGVAVARHLQSIDLDPGATAGHSVGEIAALTVSGTLEFRDALVLTRERARLMAEETAEGSMAAVLGLDAAAVVEALPEGAEIANFNGPAQTIIAGSRAALDAAKGALLEAGARRVLPLNVSGPFHSGYMKPAAEKLRDFLDDIELQAPALRFVSSVSGHDESDPETIRTLLWKQLYSPVRWTEVMAALDGEPAVECGPGNVLQGLAKRAHRGPQVSPAGTIDEARALVPV